MIPYTTAGRGALTDEGKFKDTNQGETVRNLGERLTEVLSKLAR